MQTAINKRGHLWAILIVAVLAIAGAMAANTVSADSSGISASFDETVSLPGSATERYQGNYLGSVSWVEH